MLDLNNCGEYSQEISEFCKRNKLNLNHVSYIGTGEHAASDEPIITVGLKICSAIAISYNKRNFLVHYCTQTAEELVSRIRTSFPSEAFTSATIKFHIWVGSITRWVDTNLKVLHQLGLLATIIDFELLKCALREYLANELQFIQNFHSFKMSQHLVDQTQATQNLPSLPISETLFNMLNDFMQGEVYASIETIIEANTLMDIPIDKLITALNGLYTPKTMEQFNTCTRGYFSIVTDETVVSTLTVNPIQPSDKNEMASKDITQRCAAHFLLGNRASKDVETPTSQDHVKIDALNNEIAPTGSSENRDLSSSSTNLTNSCSNIVSFS